jgi:tetratricopeptide (TPR) repeat protein
LHSEITRADRAAAAPNSAALPVLTHAIETVGPRRAWCFALSRILLAQGEIRDAFRWAHRSLALSPSDPKLQQHWLQCLAALDEPATLTEAIEWSLSLPLAGDDRLAVLTKLVQATAPSPCDPSLARAILDAVGPKDMTLRGALLAARGGDDSFAALVSERWLASGAALPDRMAVTLDLAERRRHLRDPEGEVRAVVRVVHELAKSTGSRPGLRRDVDVDIIRDLDARLARLKAPALGALEADGELAWLEANAELFDCKGKRRQAAAAWRDLGAARWDLADDRGGALAAWLRAARTAPIRGYATLGVDLVHFADAHFAFESLTKLMENERDPMTTAALSAEAARASLALGDPTRALALAQRALARDPGYADALEIAEQAASQCGQDEALEELYVRVADHALGRFGRRAAHFRAARHFERRGIHALALKHAALSFAAVPSDGSGLLLLARAAEHAGDTASAMRTVEQVAEKVQAPRARAAWLVKAASLAGSGEDGARRRVDVLLRAVLLAPDRTTLALLGDAVHVLLRLAPDERDGLELRLARATRALGEKLEAGPEGARIAIRLASLAIDSFEDREGALSAVERAFSLDADVDEYRDLLPVAPRLALAEHALAMVERSLTTAESPYSNFGVASLGLLGAIAKTRGDTRASVRAYVLAAEKAPEDAALVRDAELGTSLLQDPILEARLARAIPSARRCEVLVAWARERTQAAAYREAVAALERAVALSEGEMKRALEAELARAYDAAGRGIESENRAQQEANSPDLRPSIRATRWTELAERRAYRGDLSGSVRALLEASRLDPTSLPRWVEVERAAEQAGDIETLIRVLQEIAARVGDDGRLDALKRLARAQERHADLPAAEATWQRILEANPDDDEADQAVEARFLASSRFAELADHLQQRAARLERRGESMDALRAIRLRRAAILEQRLGRIQEACDELSKLLANSPDSSSALRYLAELYERQNLWARAAPLWRRGAALEADEATRADLELHFAKASHLAGDWATAIGPLRWLTDRPGAARDELVLYVEVARVLGDAQELGTAIERLVNHVEFEATERSDLLVEAAQAAARLGETMLAIDRARRAADATPDRAAVQLLARGLEYRLRGAGDQESSKMTLDELGKIRGALTPEDAALRAFLLAEALDLVNGPGAAIRELTMARRLAPDSALIALGFAERYASKGQLTEAVREYELASKGALFGLRRSANVALAGADVALRSPHHDVAMRLLERAAEDPELHFGALTRMVQLAITERKFPRAQGLLSQLAVLATDDDRSRELAQLAGQLSKASNVDGETLLRTLGSLIPPSAMPPEPASRISMPAIPPSSALGFDLGARSEPPRSIPLSAERQKALWTALAGGDIAAGDTLAVMLSQVSDRSGDLVRVRRAQVEALPGDFERLEQLRGAALADNNAVYARAIDHVVRVFDPAAGAVPSPPLTSQTEQPGLLAFLARPNEHPASEVMALLWEAAPQLFARDEASYALSSTERLVTGANSAVGRVYDTALHLLDIPRVQLHVARTVGAVSVVVGLTRPPVLILSGDAKDETSELRWLVGKGLASTLPHNVLLLGLAPKEGRALRNALLYAFGPDLGSSIDPETMRLTQSFWQMPARIDRRLKELFAAPFPSHEENYERAAQSARRVAFFLVGDFGFALRAYLTELHISHDILGGRRALRDLCKRLPVAADLLRLAVSPEYADARWHPLESASRSHLSIRARMG